MRIAKHPTLNIFAREDGADLLHRRAATLKRQSMAHIAEAVKLDNQLKELINDGTGESKDSGGNGEA